MFKKIISSKKIVSWILLFIQLSSAALLPLSSAVKAIENADISETMAGIQSLLEQDEINNKNARNNSLKQKSFLTNIDEHNNKITKSLPNLGSIRTLPEENHEERLASSISQVSNILSNNNSTDAAINYAKSIGEGLVNQKVNDWLGQYGTARVSINTDKKISGDFLLPIIDEPNRLLFSQLGLRNNSERNTANLGLGYRQYWGDWMYGINTFYDYDYTGSNARLGLGGEAWTDYLKLAANGYFGLTDWHQSKIAVMNDYDERPATGFDVRAEAYLLTYPKLGGSIKYEKYFGKGVHLGTGVDTDKLKDNPYALTLGINYTPIPLITLKGEHAAGDRNDTMVGMDIIYSFGVPLSQQLDPDAVDVMRSLVGNKYDFVDRNYDIVMQYRKQELINISLPAEMRAEAKETLIIPATINKTKYGLKTIKWTVSSNFIANGGSYQVISPTQLEIILPAYVYKTKTNIAQEYQISAVGIDNNNNESNRATTIIRVKPSKNVVNDLIVEPNAVLPANNKDRFTITAVITNEYGQPLSDQVITFHVDGLKQPNGQSGVTLFSGSHSTSNGEKITATTNNQGKAIVYVTSKVAGEGTITATMGNGNYKNSPIKFSSDRSSAQLAKLNVTKDRALADGKEKNILYALVTDQYGNGIENIAVNLTATDGAVIENGATANTNQSGELIFGVTSTKAGSSEVTAEINGSGKTQSVTFVTGHPSAEKSLLTAQPATIVANGKAVANLKLELKDAHDNPITGDRVTFTSSLANSLVSSSKEIGNGVYTAELTGITAGESLIEVKINGSVLKNKTVKVVLTADSENPSPVKSKLEATPDSIVANGTAFSTIQLTLKDINGNAITGHKAKVQFTTSLTNSKVGDTVEETNGIYTAKLTGTMAGESTIGVEVNGAELNVIPVIVTLTADSSNPSADKSKLEANPTRIVANGSAYSIVKLTLQDVNGNAIPGVRDKVKFITDLSNSQIGAVTEDSHGVYSAKLTGTIAGETTLSVKVNDQPLNVSPEVKVTLSADSSQPSVDKSKLVANPSSIVADGKTSSTITLELKDVNGNPLAEQGVTFETSLTGSKVGLVIDKGNGTYEASLVGTKAGQTTISVDVNGEPLVDKTATVTLTADSSQPGKDNSRLEADPTIIVADGKASSRLKLTLLDVNGNPLADQKVEFTSDLKNSHVSDAKPEGDGTYTATLTGTTEGEASIDVRVNGEVLKIKNSAKVTLIADSSNPSADKSTLEASPLTITADGAEFSTIKLTLKDINGNAISGLKDKVQFSTSLTNSKITEFFEESNGVYTAKLTGTTAGEASIEVKVNDVVLPVKVSAKIILTADSTKPGADKSKLEATPGSIVANGTAFSIIKLTLKDINGNAISGLKDKVQFSTSLTNSKITEFFEESNGVYTAKLTGTTAGEASIEVKVNNVVLSVTPVIVTLTADNENPSIDKSKFEAEPNTIVANGKDISTLKLTLKDSNDNIIIGKKVMFRPDQQEGITLSQVMDNQDGTYTATVSGTTAGQKRFSVSINDKDFTKDILVTFITYDFSINAAKKGMLVNGQFQYLITAKPSNGGKAITITSDINWSSSNTNVATINNDGLVIAKETGQSTIQATGVYKNLEFKKESLLSVKEKKFSEVYGEIRGSQDEYLIKPPSYTLYFGGGFLVDAAGTKESHTGGSGGKHLLISKLNSVSSIQITVGTDYSCNIFGSCLGRGKMIAKLKIIFKDGHIETVGEATEFSKLEERTFTIPNDYILQGIEVSSISFKNGTSGLGSISFITMPNFETIQ